MRTCESKSRYLGCMMGAAIGDALGKQNEGLTRSKILQRGYITDYGKAIAGCPGDKLGAGQYTDDTEQMLVLAQSLIECRGFDPFDFSKRLARWGKDAMSDPIRRSFIGPSSYMAISRLNSGMSWEDSGSDLPSCGSSMRVAPIGLFYKDMDIIEKYAALSSIPTHNSKNAIAGAVAVAVGVRCALLDCEDIIIVKEIVKRASRYEAVLGKKIGFAFGEKDEIPDKVFEDIGTSYLVDETVPSAFYCFFRHLEEPEDAILEAVNAGGDTDSIACITGALCGARHGIQSFPVGWIEGLSGKDNVSKAAEMIFNMKYMKD